MNTGHHMAAESLVARDEHVHASHGRAASWMASAGWMEQFGRTMAKATDAA